MSESSSSEDINNPSPPIDSQEYYDTYLNYYCPKCYHVPSIKYEGKYVEIECICGTLEDTKTQNINEELTKTKILNEYTIHKKYRILKKAFLKLNELNIFTIRKICQSKIAHPNTNKPADTCIIINDEQYFICNDCINEQKRINEIHDKCNEFKNNENEEQFVYCKKCRKKIKQNKKTNKHEGHNVINLTSLYVEEKINADIKYLKENSIVYKSIQLLNKIQESINKSKILVQKQIENEQKFFMFIKLQYTNHQLFANEVTLNNVKNINVQKNLSSQNKRLIEGLKEIFMNSLNEYKQIVNEIQDFNENYQKFNEDILNKQEYVNASVNNYNVNMDLFTSDPTQLSPVYTVADNNFSGSNLIAVYDIDGNYELAHATKKPEKSIQIIDLLNNNIKHTIKSAHSTFINFLKHYYNSASNIHYLISSSEDISVKLWNINNDYSNILSISNTSSTFESFPLCMIFDNNNAYIASGNKTKKIKIYDCTGTLIETIRVDYKSITNLETYYINNKTYILISGQPGIFLYDYTDKSNKYNLIANDDKDVYHYLAIIQHINNQLIIFDSDGNGYVTLWNFDTGEVLNTIKPGFGKHMGIFSFCIWNDIYLITGGKDRGLKIFDLRTSKQIKVFLKAHFKGYSHKQSSNGVGIKNVIKINIKDKGEFLVTSGDDHKIILWKDEN